MAHEASVSLYERGAASRTGLIMGIAAPSYILYSAICTVPTQQFA